MADTEKAKVPKPDESKKDKVEEKSELVSDNIKTITARCSLFMKNLLVIINLN